MIPKIIHYCWFGGKPLPKFAKKCIESWRKYLPDYEIKEWNESNFDVNICQYTQEAYQSKKYAFVSDYARFWILYHYGGIYFDTDVEVIRPMQHILEKGDFMACEIKETNEEWPRINSGLGLASCKIHPIYKDILNHYEQSTFLMHDGSVNYMTVVQRVTNIFKNYGLRPIEDIQVCEGITIYPPDYFCPKSFETREISITKNTVAIHHFDASWMKGSFVFNLSRKIFGTELTFRIKKYFKRNRRI